MAEREGATSTSVPAAALSSNVPVGKLIQYSQGTDWQNYTEQLSFFFLANGVTDEKRKKAILMSNIPAETYQVVKDLLAPAALTADDVTYSWIVDVMKEHVKPVGSRLSVRYDNRVRHPNESVAEFVKALKHLATECKFSNEMRTESLRDRLIAGIRDGKMLRALLSKKITELTFEGAVQQCVAIEWASKDVVTLQGGATVNRGAESETPTICQMAAKQKCYRCNGTHNPQRCPFKTATCYGCGKRCHVKPVCRSSCRSGHPGSSVPVITFSREGRSANSLLTKSKRLYPLSKTRKTVKIRRKAHLTIATPCLV